MGCCLLTVDKGDDMRMVKTFQNVDFGVKVLLQLLVEFVEVDRLDSNETRFLLCKERRSACESLAS